MSQQPHQDEPTIGRLIGDAQKDISKLIQSEIQLAKTELKISVKAGTAGIGLFAAAGFLLLLAIIIFSIALAQLIHWNGDGLDLHWAYLIVFGVYTVLAVLLVLVGVSKVKKVKAPERAIAQAQETKAAFAKH
ncbi:phage holin family protein [Nocardioides daejeonensis]|uniref:phage holin family protein n=1 Tax=Nocardioides daejeonensis TaxID=1046556 RepID=UPI000D745CAF|nr:phage holin family protein [Nocardioides daejeonensis]